MFLLRYELDQVLFNKYNHIIGLNLIVIMKYKHIVQLNPIGLYGLIKTIYSINYSVKWFNINYS